MKDDHELSQRIPFDQSRRSDVAAIELDEDSECGLFRENR